MNIFEINADVPCVSPKATKNKFFEIYKVIYI